MKKSIKLQNENYIDSTGIVHNKKLLSDILYIKYNLISNGTPVKLGYQVNGKDVYGKLFNLGTPPNNTSQSYTHNITGYDRIWVDLGSSYIIHNNGVCFPFHDNRDGYNMGVIITETEIEVKITASYWNGYTMYVLICFTMN